LRANLIITFRRAPKTSTILSQSIFTASFNRRTRSSEIAFNTVTAK